MKKSLLVFFVLALMNSAFAQHDGHGLTNAKVAHDASHRVGKLVDTGRIDSMYLTNMRSLVVEAIPHTNHAGPAFTVTASAGAGDAQVSMNFDMAGKFLPPHKVSGTSAVETNPWQLDSSELLEAALHWVMEASAPGVDFNPFRVGLVKASLSSQTNSDGSVQPAVRLTSSSSTRTLTVVLTLTGEFTSYSIVE